MLNLTLLKLWCVGGHNLYSLGLIKEVSALSTTYHACLNFYVPSVPGNDS